MSRVNEFFLEFTPVTGLSASFSPVTPKAGLKKCAANFFKGENAAAFRFRSPPAEEANCMDRIEKRIKKGILKLFFNINDLFNHITLSKIPY